MLKGWNGCLGMTTLWTGGALAGMAIFIVVKAPWETLILVLAGLFFTVRGVFAIREGN